MRIDDTFMKEIGLEEMPEAEKQAFINHAEEELEVRVGRAISKEVSQDQLHDFESIDDNEQAITWLESNIPDFRKIVSNIFQEFKQELISERASILD